MKALIVDDEKHVREAIKLLVDWKAAGVNQLLEAESGECAVSLMTEERPELVFTDMMMPGMDGVGLLEWINRHAPRTKTIVISGHDDFEYVRNTVKYGGLDYILKPIDPEQLREAVNKAVENRRQDDQALLQNQRRAMEMNQIKPVYWDKMFSNLLDDPGYYKKIRDNLEQEFGLAGGAGNVRAAILSLEPMPEDIRRKFALNQDLLQYSIINICNEVLSEGKRGFAFRHWNNGSQIVLLLWKDTIAADSVILHINDSIARALGGRFQFGLGRPFPFPEGIGTSYREAAGALKARNLLKRDGWIHLPQGTSGSSATPLNFSDHEESFRVAILTSQEEHLIAALNRWFEAVHRLESISVEQMEQWYREYNVMKARLAKEFAEDDQGTPFEFEPEGGHSFADALGEDGAFSLKLWKDRLTEDMLRLAKLLRKQRQGDRHIIFEIAKYIEQNYGKDITLQDIANRFFLSREYISRKFKLEFKENLSDYLGRIRIEKAKLLLLNPDARISQVAELVGIQDEKYFSKVFKKLTGLSPNEYRKLHARP